MRKTHRGTSLKHRFTLERKPSGGKAQNQARRKKVMEMEKKDRWVAINRTLGSLALSTRAFKGSVGILFYRLKYRWFLVRPVSHPLDEDHRTHKGVYLSSIPSRCPHIDLSISLFSSRPWNLRNYECFASLIRSFENGHPVDLVALKRFAHTAHWAAG